MYQALYRKYRSRNFDEVVGQEHITVTLKNEIASGRIGHAYLFTGSRGVGKTSCSRIIAKAVNCPNQTDGNPCGECDICRGIDEGSILDVTEIDAASNNGVDNIRQLREEANFTPAVVQYRVYIIDEAHMLSIGAFNALLKILEEPPEHVIFILATTEIHKIPATILSRCQRFDFRRIKSEVIQEHLLSVCQDEGILIEQDAAKLIARLSEGGMRDALSLLDVCRSTANQKNGCGEEEIPDAITVSVVSEAAGLAVQDCLFEIADAVLNQDIPAIISLIDQMYENSIDYEKMCSQLISHYRGLMMARAVKEPERFILGAEEELARIKQQAQAYSMPQILYCLTVLQDTISRINKTSQTRTELEMAVIKLTNPASEDTIEAINARLTRLEDALKAGQFAARKPVRPAESSPLPDSFEPAQQRSPAAEEKKTDTLKQVEVTKFQQWPEVLETLRHSNNALHGALVNASAYQKDGLILIDCDNPFFLELIRSNEYAKKSIHDALIQAAGKDFRIGPYKKEKYRCEEEKDDSDPLETILNTAMEQGIPVDIKDK